MDTSPSCPEIARLGLIHNWRFQQLRFDRYTKMLHANCEITGNIFSKNATVVEAWKNSEENMTMIICKFA